MIAAVPGVTTAVGVISDTHGLMRPEALRALSGVSVILHAGDVGGPEILEQLSMVAPVVAVRGNTDRGEWAATLRPTEWVELGGQAAYVLHDIALLDLDPAAAGVRVVVHGHSHQPRAVERGGVLYLNPGSAGPRRFSLPVAVARLYVCGDTVHAEHVDLG